MLASSPVILLAFNSHFCDAILTPESKQPDKPANQTLSTPLNHPKPLTPDQTMNTFTTSSPSQNTASEPSLGWNSMPAYGEVMSEMKGIQFTQIPSIQAPASKTNLFMESFWNTVRGQLLALAA
jgi:hypothetical protein